MRLLVPHIGCKDSVRNVSKQGGKKRVLARNVPLTATGYSCMRVWSGRFAVFVVVMLALVESCSRGTGVGVVATLCRCGMVATHNTIHTRYSQNANYCM